MKTQDRRSSAARRLGEAGQVLLLYLIFLIPMTMVLLSVYNVGMTVSEKMKVQNAADNAAYSAAVWEARYMNLSAYMSRAMVANYDAIATLDSIWSFIDANDGFMQLARRILDIFFDVGEVLAPVHEALHQANKAFTEIIGGGQKNKRVGFAIEEYTLALSKAQSLLYALNQAGRNQVIQGIAHGVDANLQYFLPAEVLNFAELQNRRKFAGTDDNGLRLTTERSLNALSNGGSFRDAENFLPGPLRTLKDLIDKIPCFSVEVGPHGFDGPGFDHVSGAPGGSGETTIIRNDKIYERDREGIAVKFDCLVSFEIGVLHHSDDAFNLPNAATTSVPHIADDEGDHSDLIQKNTDCSLVGGSFSGPSGDLNALKDKLKTLGDLNKLCQANDPSRTRMQQIGLVQVEQVNTDASGDPKKANFVNCSSVQDQMKDASKSLQSGAGLTASSKPCADVYQYATQLRDMEVTTYVEDGGVLDGRRLEGPTIFVYLRKPFGKLPVFRGLGLGNDRNVEAYALSKVYYTQRPGDVDGTQADGRLNDTRVSNKETIFDPFWAARLEKWRPLGINVLLH